MAELGTVYILETQDHRFLKIGFTTRLMMRVEQLRLLALPWMGTDLVLVGFFPATRDVETQLHRRFAEARVHGDWYKYEPVIQAFSTVIVPVVPIVAVMKPKCESITPRDLNAHAVALGRNGGKARKAALTPARRSEIARGAINTRWDRVRAARTALASKQAKRKRGRAGVQPRLS